MYNYKTYLSIISLCIIVMMGIAIISLVEFPRKSEMNYYFVSRLPLKVKLVVSLGK